MALFAPDADECSAAMEIGDSVTFEGRVYVLRGIEPMSVDDRRVMLADPATGEVVLAPVEAVLPAAFEEKPGS